tara:strand:- start:303 stop:1175 length:873 start_codon:yes stop_codon:yes gene_type:complete
MKKIKILIPVYNDWQSVSILLKNIDLQINDLKHEFSVLIINDASNEERPDNIGDFNNLKSIEVVNMMENRGHARCNAAGLKYINEQNNFDYIIPMDGDGEDRPEELKLLIEKIKDYPDKVITANRVKRSEGIFFKFCYLIHKYLTFFFTGQSIKFGNYVCLPKFIVNKMVNEAATWSSFSGSLAKVEKYRVSISSIRASRYFGISKMSFFNLLKHSLSIIAVFKSTLLIRSILFLVAYLFLIIEKVSIITLIPVITVIIMMISVVIISRRESLAELNVSLENIKNIDKIK